MEYRALGRTGIKVTPICLGCMMFGGRTEERPGIEIIHKAIDSGINFLDTANVYSRGRSEEVTGKALACYQETAQAIEDGSCRDLEQVKEMLEPLMPGNL